MKSDRFGKITQRRIHRIKNHSIWIKIRREIKERIRLKFPNAKKEKSKIKKKLTKSTILNYILMIQDERLRGKYII